MKVVSCELLRTFVQVRVALVAGRPRRATSPINNGWILEWACRRACFVIFSCFAQQENWASETRLPVEVLGLTRPREVVLVVGAGEVGYPNT